MQPTNWTAAEARSFLEGMRAVATVRGTRPIDPISQEMLESVGHHVLHAQIDINTLADRTPGELAANIGDSRRQREFVQFLILMPYLDMEVDPAQVAVVEDIAGELGIATDTLTDLRQVRDGRMKRLLFDYSRRALTDYADAESAWQKIGLITKTLHQAIGDAKVAKRFLELEQLPEGSLGHSFFRFYRARSFPLPGEKKSFGELLVPHDCSHILGGFNTDMNGEMNVGGFEAGVYDDSFGFELLLEVILDFHLGKKFTTLGLLPPGTNHFDPDQVMIGYERGLACNVNLFKGWDFWAVAGEQLTDLRSRYGIPEIPGPLLPEPPASITTTPDHAGDC